MEKNFVENWRFLIVETENRLKKFGNTSDLISEDNYVFEIWENFLINQKNSLENYINFLNRSNRDEQ